MYNLPTEDMAKNTAEHFKKIRSALSEVKDAPDAWSEYLKYHRDYNGPGSTPDDTCKYWFMLGYLSKTL